MIKAFLICILSFLVVEINSLSSSEKSFPCESFIKGGRQAFIGIFYPALQGVWAPVPRAPGIGWGKSVNHSKVGGGKGGEEKRSCGLKGYNCVF